MMTTGTVGGHGDTWLLQVSNHSLNLVLRLSLLYLRVNEERAWKDVDVIYNL